MNCCSYEYEIKRLGLLFLSYYIFYKAPNVFSLWWLCTAGRPVWQPDSFTTQLCSLTTCRMWTWMRVSTSRSEDMDLCQKLVKCSLCVSEERLPPARKFKHIGILFTSDGELELDQWISAASAVLWTLYQTVVVTVVQVIMASVQVYNYIHHR